MGDINDLLNVGNGILNDVTHAIETGNFDGLGARTKERVTFAATQFTQTGVQPGYRGPIPRHTAPLRQTAGQRGGQPGMQPGNVTAAYRHTGYQPYQYNTPNGSYFLARPQRRLAGVAQIVLGSIGTFVGGIGALSSFGAAVTASAVGDIAGAGIIGAAAAGTGIFFSAVLFISLGVLRSGVKLKNLIRRYYEYGAAVGGAEYFNIEQLAGKVGTTAKELTRDLETMIRKHILPGARMDRKKTTCMLTDRAYQQYLQAEQSRVEREAQAQMRGEPVIDTRKEEDSEVKRILDDGNRAIIQVRAINDEIPDTQIMSDKLYRLEEIMRRIFEQVQKDPSSAPDLRRFMDYYLPTTTKLLTAYVELDRQPVQGENIKKTKAEIETSLDTINDAFEQLLDGMFSDMAMDISTDISVMKTMMKQDGLSQDDALFGTGPVPQPEGLKFGE